MAFTLFYLLEACLLIANAVAILNERFLKQSKYTAGLTPRVFWRQVGFHVDNISMGGKD